MVEADKERIVLIAVGWAALFSLFCMRSPPRFSSAIPWLKQASCPDAYRNGIGQNRGCEAMLVTLGKAHHGQGLRYPELPAHVQSSCPRPARGRQKPTRCITQCAGYCGAR